MPMEREHVERAGLVAAGGRLKGDFRLRDEAGRADVPRADQRGPQRLEMLPLHVENAGAERPEHPLVGIGGEEIDVAHVDGGGAERLDGVEAEENAAAVQFLAMPS